MQDIGNHVVIDEEYRHCRVLDSSAEKNRLERGKTALSKEKLRREFDEMIRDLSKLDKKERIRRVQEEPFPVRKL